jgi:hypothetical protein
MDQDFHQLFVKYFFLTPIFLNFTSTSVFTLKVTKFTRRAEAGGEGLVSQQPEWALALSKDRAQSLMD